METSAPKVIELRVSQFGDSQEKIPQKRAYILLRCVKIAA
jgi:hypothetical protein